MGVGTRREPHLAVGAERELEAPPPPSAAAEAEGFGDIISPESPGAGALVRLAGTGRSVDGLEM